MTHVTSSAYVIVTTIQHSGIQSNQSCFHSLKSRIWGSEPIEVVREQLPSGKRLHNYGNIHHCSYVSWENKLSIAIFNIHVKLPEGITPWGYRWGSPNKGLGAGY